MVFQKSRLNRAVFRTTLKSLDWVIIYNQLSADYMSYIFLLSGALKQHALLKKSLFVHKNP